MSTSQIVRARVSAAARDAAKYNLPFKADARLDRVPLGWYRHNETGNEYQVIGHGLRVRETEAFCAYRNKELAPGQWWERLLDGKDGFCTPNADGTPRFTKIADKD